ncbi:lipopolysaccharide core biosynthesis protein WbcM [Gluconobacter thailandicus F149-1 = NBRC 100600]|uniref:Lipopolysaccharide core biosynthesis protein WbcM n=1 Tax=Gluconobacter thailandicus NBRC 3257 TaxID=1381097 RepID=A0ABQ0IUG4_GLUTH|nr:glycosyltransferase family 4 protein [Gluconobacter thailandicus]KXV54010.1 lipopolysaccharide biosynthesis protein [Gluconobacter thailandicus]GAC88249.1 lipopolysaccharide core biosynthesis protein WbcM [Gluconobacter thailandicus NBRC 3255]GAD25847.1 lipopolysaccharide core biosynthesis protein WbcM [Gluconobacter thailandicus NBRC 3257]GAN92373.1 lipopolysaccharide core biosynthesis protein WbcM [Gluconobacter thailandicus F149-1 = NBRC 100600]GEL87231.1 putative glycosyltransferase [Gl
MRCAFVIQHINATGGTERSACAVMNGLVQRDVTVHLLELVGNGPPVFPLDDRIPVKSLFEKPVKIFNSWLRIVGRLVRYLKRHRIDTLVVVEATHALYGVAAARLAGSRCIVWEHFNFNITLERRKRVWGRQIAARWADDVVVLTARDKALWQAGREVRASLTVIPNMAPPVWKTPYDDTSRTVLTIGRLTTQKGHDLLLEAWQKVESDARGTGWSLLIRGDGPEWDLLHQAINGLSHVTLAPATHQIEAEYRGAGLYVCSSRYEGLPMVLLEASSAGLPIVSFACETGPAEIVEDGVNGVLVQPGDIPELAEALLSLMAQTEKRRTMSAMGRRKALEFQEETVMARWMDLLSLPRGV